MNRRIWWYTEGMHAVTEISNGMEEPSSCGMSTVTALPPTRDCASYSRKSNRSGCRCNAQATPSPETPAPMMAIFLRPVRACGFTHACYSKELRGQSKISGEILTLTPRLPAIPRVDNPMIFRYNMPKFWTVITGSEFPLIITREADLQEPQNASRNTLNRPNPEAHRLYHQAIKWHRNQTHPGAHRQRPFS